MKKIFAFLALSLLAIFILLSNLKGLRNDCFHAVDFSIYQQPILKMSMGDFNPSTSVRSANTWNDHFDPALLLFVPLVKIFNYSPYILIFGEWFAFILFAFVLCREKKFKFNSVLLIFALAFLSRPFLIALESPIHPVTWSGPVLAALFIAIFHGRYRTAYLMGIFLCFFRETYCLSLVSLSFFFLLIKERRSFLMFFGIGVMWFLIAFKLRPLVVGPLWPYGDNILAGFKLDPVKALITLFTQFNYVDTLKSFFPLFLLFPFELKRLKKSPLLPVLFFLAPLVGMHFIFNRFTFHYGVQFAAPLITAFVLSKSSEELLTYKKYFLLIIILLILTASSRYTKVMRLLFLDKGSKCTMEEVKTSGADFIQSYVTKEIKKNESIISTGGIIPRLVTTEIQPFLIVIDAPSFEKPQNEYDYLILETGEKNIPWDLTLNSVLNVKEKCRTYSSKILLESEFHFFAKGPFPRNCILEGLKDEFNARKGIKN